MRDPDNFNGTIPLALLRYRPGTPYWHCSPDAFTVGEKDSAEKMKSLKKLPAILPTMYPPSEYNVYLYVCMFVCTCMYVCMYVESFISWSLTILADNHFVL